MLQYLLNQLRDEVVLDVQANRLLGVATYGLLTKYHEQANVPYPQLAVSGMNSLLNTMIRVMLPRLNRLRGLEEEVAQLLLGADPTLRFCHHVYAPMAWASLLAPERAQEIVQVTPVIQSYLKTEARCGIVSKPDVLAFNARLLEFMAVPSDPTRLNASGYALYCAATEKLRTLAVRNTDRQARKRRQKYLATIFEYCMQMQTADLPGRKHKSALVAEALATELQRSGCRDVNDVIQVYWGKFELFTYGSRFV
jgi:hypothetical protein